MRRRVCSDTTTSPGPASDFEARGQVGRACRWPRATRRRRARSPTTTTPVAMPMCTLRSTVVSRGPCGLGDAERGAYRPLRVVLVRARIAEVGEDAVAHQPRDDAVVPLDDLGAVLPVRLDHFGELFRIEAQRQARRLHDVAEHHGELAALGAARGGHRVDHRKVGARLGVPQGLSARWRSDRRGTRCGPVRIAGPASSNRDGASNDASVALSTNITSDLPAQPRSWALKT